MPADYDVITFDCYGTLIDWERGIHDAFAALAQEAGVVLDAMAALAAYHAVEPAVQSESYRPYREVLAEAARRAAAKQGWAMDDTTAQAFAARLPAWPPFPDTDAALLRMAEAGYRLGILSNVDDQLLHGTLRHFSAPIELIVTAQQVGSYKPAHGHFLRAREQIGDLRWLHAAQSHFHDVVPAGALGVPVVWVNRKRELLPPGGPAPLAEVATLAELADWLAKGSYRALRK
jgi:2-haloalkanoic acid dehalogenase type II